jgi:hypothetical protein
LLRVTRCLRKRLVIVKSGTPQALGAFQAALEQVLLLLLPPPPQESVTHFDAGG